MLERQPAPLAHLASVEAGRQRMITYDDLNTQSHEITELANVLSFLLKDRSMCDTRTCCELFYRYGEKIDAHLDTVDHTYTALLNSRDEHAKNVAHRFMGGSQEIKRIFNQYKKKWYERSKCRLHISDYDTLLNETEQVFDLVLSRILDETEELFPLVRTVTGDAQQAA
jgi:hypothetical protein